MQRRSLLPVNPMRLLLILAASLLLLGCSGQRSEPVPGCTCTAAYSPVCGADNSTYNSSCLARCANTSVSHEGACVQCSDSDGGKDPLAKGTASAAGLSYTDECVNFTAVTEYFCNGEIVSKQAMPCPEGDECLDGACSKPPPAPPLACQDSDGGPDPYTRGTASSGQTVYTDSCTADKQLREYDCANGSVTASVSPCPSGSRCDSGRCLRADVKCVESDGGRDIYNAGDLNASINLVSVEYLDKCLDSGTLREYYCVGDDYVSEDVTCPPDYQCVKAACKQVACTDTDGGINIYQTGAVSKGAQVLRDQCAGNGGGIEYYCDGNQAMNASFDCPDGYFCLDGRCTR